MTMISPEVQAILPVMVLIACVALGTMTTSDSGAPMSDAVCSQTFVRKGSQDRRMNLSGKDSISSVSFRAASMTGRGGVP